MDLVRLTKDKAFNPSGANAPDPAPLPAASGCRLRRVVTKQH